MYAQYLARIKKEMSKTKRHVEFDFASSKQGKESVVHHGRIELFNRQHLVSYRHSVPTIRYNHFICICCTNSAEPCEV